MIKDSPLREHYIHLKQHPCPKSEYCLQEQGLTFNENRINQVIDE